MKTYLVKIIATELVEKVVRVEAESRMSVRVKVRRGEYREAEELERHRKSSQVVTIQEEKS